MNRWRGKVAVVTGASSGIGLATAKALISHGLIVVGFARRKEMMENEMKSSKGPGEFYARQCDITNEGSIAENLKWVKDTFGAINILINNAGIMHYKLLESATVSELDEVVNVNFLGLLHATKHAIPILKSNQKEAHIINVNSLLGHKIPPSTILNVYPATKFAVTALTETLSNELKDSKIRVSSISPSIVKTDMVEKMFAATPTVLENYPALHPEDIASAIIYALGAPDHVEISDIILQAKASK